MRPTLLCLAGAAVLAVACATSALAAARGVPLNAQRVAGLSHAETDRRVTALGLPATAAPNGAGPVRLTYPTAGADRVRSSLRASPRALRRLTQLRGVGNANASTARHPGRGPAPATTLHAALRRLHAAGAPGAVALAGGQVIAAGSARRDGHRPLTGRTPLRIGSVTKEFTAAVALQLVGEHRLALSDTVGALLPEAPPAAGRVTLRELLDHTSGLADDVRTPIVQLLDGDRDRVWTKTALLDQVRDLPPRFAPGTRYAYSNTDYLLVGLIIEHVTHHSLGNELRRRILRPLHLRDTRFPVAATRLPGPARGYSLGLDGGPALLDVTDYSPSFAWGSGNGVSTLRDLARFQHALLGGRLLPERLRRAMLHGVPTGQPGERSGLGVELVSTPQGLRVGHAGDILGFSVELFSDARGGRPAIAATDLKLAPPAVGEALDTAEAAATRAACARPRTARSRS